MAEPPPVARPRFPPPGAAPRPRRVLGTLTGRAVLAGCLVAVVAVVVTALVALPLAARAASRAERAGLANQADIAAAAIDLRPGSAVALVRELHSQGIEVYVVRAGRIDRTGLPGRLVRPVTAGTTVSGTARVDGRVVLVEGRPLPGTGNGVILTQPAATGTAPAVLRRLWLALLAGLLAGALAGALLARRLARPIRHAAAAAARLQAGDRSVRVRPEPPAEVEELAHAVNQLAAALATSESRQREFLLSISHELRTPLATLQGYAEALADGVIEPDGAAEAGRTMLAEAGRLDRLVADLLALARLDAVDFPLSVLPVDLTGLVGDAARAWAARCGSAGVVLRTELPPVPVTVPTDPTRIRQVIDGLLENALRVVPAGAPVVLAVRPPVTAGWPGLGAGGGPGLGAGGGPGLGAGGGPGLGAGGFGVVEVRDGGPGLTDADLAVAFQRGVLHDRYRGVRKVGSGLGLALAAGLVRRLGGTVEAGHAPEGGARFTVSLPVYPIRTSR